MLDVRHSIDKPYGYVSVDLRVFGYKNEPFVFAKDVEQVFYVPDLVMKNWSMVLLEKRIVGAENVVEEEEYNLFDKIPSLIIHASPYSWELTKHRTCVATIVKQSIKRNQGRKSKLDFC
jgi:hypothetical protein